MDHPMPSTTSGNPSATELRQLLAAVLDALTLPYDTPDYNARILDRAGLARTVVGAVLTEDQPDVGWDTNYLRGKLAAEQADAEKKAVCASVDRAFPVVARFLADERAELSRKVAEANKRSESRPR